MSNRDSVGLKGVGEAGTLVRRNLQKSREWPLWPGQGRQQERQRDRFWKMGPAGFADRSG